MAGAPGGKILARGGHGNWSRTGPCSLRFCRKAAVSSGIPARPRPTAAPRHPQRGGGNIAFSSGGLEPPNPSLNSSLFLIGFSFFR